MVVDIGAFTLNVDDICYGVANTIASTGGEERHTPVAGEMFAHTHDVNADASVNNGVKILLGQGKTVQGSFEATSSQGSSRVFNEMSPYLSLNYIIKT